MEEKGTTLSRHIHSLRRAGTSFTITWDLLEKRLTGYNITSKSCRLCLLEKFSFWFGNPMHCSILISLTILLFA